MKEIVKRCLQRLAGDSGSILMEYVVVVCGLAVLLIAFTNLSFYDVSSGWGPLGQQLVAFYQRTLGGLSLPIP